MGTKEGMIAKMDPKIYFSLKGTEKHCCGLDAKVGTTKHIHK